MRGYDAVSLSALLGALALLHNLPLFMTLSSCKLPTLIITYPVGVCLELVNG